MLTSLLPEAIAFVQEEAPQIADASHICKMTLRGKLTREGTLNPKRPGILEISSFGILVRIITFLLVKTFVKTGCHTDSAWGETNFFDRLDNDDKLDILSIDKSFNNSAVYMSKANALGAWNTVSTLVSLASLIPNSEIHSIDFGDMNGEAFYFLIPPERGRKCMN
jgi:hypothetical protein